MLSCFFITFALACFACFASVDASLNVSAVPYFPNIGYLARGYDIVTGNPHSTTSSDPGFRQSIFQFAYEQQTLTADYRYMIPDGVDAIPQLDCSYDADTHEIKGEQSYVDSLKVSVSVEGGYGVGSFSASTDYKRVSQEIYDQHMLELHVKAQCSVYNAKLQTFNLPNFTFNFKASILQLTKEPSNADLANQIVQAFGTHMVSEVVMGSKVIKHDLLSQSSYQTMHDEDISVSATAKLSFGLAYGSVSTTTEVEKKQIQKYDESVTRHFFTYIGAKPSGNGDTSVWSELSGESPFPHSYTLQPLYKLLTATHFPEADAAGLQSAQNALSDAISRWCSNAGISGVACSGARPDVDISSGTTKVFSNSGSGTVHFPCPSGNPISVGMVSRQAIDGKYGNYPRYGIVNGEASCTASENHGCNALCSTGFSDIQIVEAPRTNKWITADCPAGYVVGSCHYSAVVEREYEIYPISYPQSSTSCSCYNWFSPGCQAVCIPASQVTDYQIVSQYGTDKFKVTCPQGKRLLGCGFQSPYEVQGVAGSWSVGPSSPTECECNNGSSSATCYAICGVFK